MRLIKFDDKGVIKMTVQRYVLSLTCKAGTSDNRTTADNVDFRIDRMVVHIGEPNLVVLQGLYVNCEENELVASTDGYQYSAALRDKLYQAFLKEHGLTEKTPSEVDEYLDENGLNIPDPCRVVLPNLKKGGFIRVVGTFQTDTIISFAGMARVSD